MVDDNASNRRILAGSLRRWGMRPTVVENGAAALEALGALANRFPLILTDVHMPEMDGFELAAHIKRLANTPMIVMLTSGSYAGDTARCRESGIEAYLTKPIAHNELRETILRVIARGPKRPGAGADPARECVNPSADKAAFRDNPLRILLAEDNLVNQKVALAMLKRQGHLVVVAGNGVEVVQAVERESFDLVLMDIQMPEMGGFEATAVIRARERKTGMHLPIGCDDSSRDER